MTRHSLARNALLGGIVVAATLAGPQFFSLGNGSGPKDSPAEAAAPAPAIIGPRSLVPVERRHPIGRAHHASLRRRPASRPTQRAPDARTGWRAQSAL